MESKIPLTTDRPPPASCPVTLRSARLAPAQHGNVEIPAVCRRVAMDFQAFFFEVDDPVLEDPRLGVERA